MHSLPSKILKNNVWLICIILLLGIIAHSSMLPATFKTLDDSFSIIDNADIKDIANIPELFKLSFFGDHHYYRPMVSVSFAVEHHFFGLKPFYYNLTNLILHLSIAVSVLFLLLLIQKDRAVAFFSSLLFAVHPVQWEAVANIPGRAVLLATFFTINAFIFYCLARDQRRSIMYLGLSLILFACGLLSKESAAMLPILLLSFCFLIEKNPKRYAPIMLYFVIIGIYMFVRYSLGITQTYPWRTGSEYVLGFLTFLRACLTYLRLLVWPVDLHFDRAREMFLSFTDPHLWETVIAYLTGLFVLLKTRKRLTGLAVFFMAWICIELFPVSQVVTSIGVQPGYISAAEHFLYMPVIGAFVLLVLALKAIYEFNSKRGYWSANAFRVLMAGFVLFFMLITVRQGFEARSSVTMFRRTLSQNPGNVRILYSMGIEMVNRGRFPEGEQYFRRALEIDPLHLTSYLALGRALHDQGKFVESIAIYEGVDQAGRWDELLAQNLEDAYQGAINNYKQLILQAPDNAQVHYSLGTIYSRSGRIQDGIKQYSKAIAIDPVYKRALFNLASSYEALGDQELAVEMYERMIAVEDEAQDMDRFAYKQLSEIYRRQGDEVKAVEYLNKLNVN